MKDRNTKLILSTKGKDGESFGNTAFADKLVGALHLDETKPATVPVTPTEPETVAKAEASAVVLPDVKAIAAEKVVIPTLKDAEAKIGEEVGTVKQWAEEAGAEIARIDVNLERVNAEIFKVEKRIRTEPDVRLSATLRELYSQLEEAKKKEVARRARLLDAGGEDLKAHVQFVRFLEEIRTTNHLNIGEVREIFSRVHQLEFRKLVSKDELEKLQKGLLQNHQGPIFFEGQISVPVSATGGQKGLEAELRKLTDAAKNSKAASIRMRGNADLHGLSVGKPGFYYGYFPKRTEKAHITEGGVQIPERKHFEGHVLIELRDLNAGKFYVEKGKKIFRKPYVVVMGRDAVGSASWMEGKSVPYFWVEQRRVIPPKDKETGEPKRLDEKEFEQSLRFINAIWALYGVWHKGSNPKPVEAKPEEGPTVNAVADTDMSGVIVETKPATPSPAETAKKVKKTKK